MDIGPQLGENQSVSRSLLALTSLLLACGPGPADTETTSDTTTSDTTTSDTTTSDTTTSVTTTSDTTTSATTSTADPTQAPTSTDTTSTSGPSTATDTTLGDTTTTTTETTGGEDIQYAAVFWAGGLDHLLIHRADFTNDRCTTLHLARPGEAQPPFMIDVPEQWFPADASITDSSDGCLQDMPIGTTIAASSGGGTVTWPQDPNQFCPPLIDLDVILDFPQDQPWVPAQVSMTVTALSVENCQ